MRVLSGTDGEDEVDLVDVQHLVLEHGLRRREEAAGHAVLTQHGNDVVAVVAVAVVEGKQQGSRRQRSLRVVERRQDVLDADGGEVTASKRHLAAELVDGQALDLGVRRLREVAHEVVHD